MVGGHDHFNEDQRKGEGKNRGIVDNKFVVSTATISLHLESQNVKSSFNRSLKTSYVSHFTFYFVFTNDTGESGTHL